MAWRPTSLLIGGFLENTEPGRVTGQMLFAGLKKPVVFDLRGDFHRDIRGARIEFGPFERDEDGKGEPAEEYMRGFARVQVGETGDITAGLPPADYVEYPYIEWYGDDNGRVVIELSKGDVCVVGSPIPAMESYALDRDEEARKMDAFMSRLCESVRKEGTSDDEE